jgi:hypothetical protein
MIIKISSNGRHFATSDGSPFFWLADTAWNAPLRADTEDWIRYLDLRKKQGFTAIQFVTSPWRGRKTPVHGRLFEEKEEQIVFDENAFRKMEEWFTLISERDMVPVPVMLWDLNPDEPFFERSDEFCIEAGKKLLSRFSRFDPVWFLAGDGDYRSVSQTTRWKKIGRAVFGSEPGGPVTMHSCGCSWAGDLFKDEPWYSFVGIQSGHGTVHHDLNFLLTGPYSYRWKEIQKPFINIEPNYEHAVSYHENIPLDAYYVRRASYWSLLGAPPAGITYGNNNIWVWAQEDGEFAEGHGQHWAADTWKKGLETPGIENLAILKGIFEMLPWTGMLPADYLLAEQPGWQDPNQFIKVSAAPEEECIAAYLPKGGEIRFAGLPFDPASVSWVNPRTGEWTECTGFTDMKAEAPDKQDWLLVLKG